MKNGFKLKQAFASILTAALAFSLVACGGGASTPSVAGSTSAGSGAAGAKLRVGIVTSSGVDDGSFGQDCYMGIRDYVDANKDTATDNNVKEPDVGKVVQAVGDIIADYDVMVCPGFQFAPVGSIAAANPDKKFIIVDAAPSDENGDTILLDNVYSMTFREEESGFLAGVVAALETKTNKVAVVNGIAFPSNVNYQFGFMSGVNYANEKLGTKAEIIELPSYAGTDVQEVNVGGNYIGAFADQATGKLVGAALIKEGVDIMLIAAGDSGNGVFAAIKEAKDVFAIGCDIDQYDDGETGSRNIVLTSVIKNMRMNVAIQLAAVAEGTFKGENAVLGADTDSTGYVTAEGRHQMAAETITKINAALEDLKAGKITPAANFNGHTPTDFPGLK